MCLGDRKSRFVCYFPKEFHCAALPCILGYHSVNNVSQSHTTQINTCLEIILFLKTKMCLVCLPHLVVMVLKNDCSISRN